MCDQNILWLLNRFADSNWPVGCIYPVSARLLLVLIYHVLRTFRLFLHVPTVVERLLGHLPRRGCRGLKTLKMFGRLRSFKCGLQRDARPQETEKRMEWQEMPGKFARLEFLRILKGSWGCPGAVLGAFWGPIGPS